MSHLSRENINKCVSLISDFIEQSKADSERKGAAVLALRHLQQITAGTGNEGDVANVADEGGPRCIGRPLADPSPEV